MARKKRSGIGVPEPSYWDFFPANPAMPATDLIARVYEALEFRQIPFYFSYYLGDALATRGVKEHVRVHFFLPQHNVAIIVQGGFWFDKANNLNNTALDLALIEYAGIKPIWWTEPDIMARGVDELIRETPELNVPYTPGPPMMLDYEPFDYRGAVQRPPRPYRKEREVKMGGKRRPQRW